MAGKAEVDAAKLPSHAEMAWPTLMILRRAEHPMSNGEIEAAVAASLSYLKPSGRG